MENMPKTKGESVFFTAITAWMMVFGMTVYNDVLVSGSFTNATFLNALKGMWIEYVIIFLLAFFVAPHFAKRFAFKIVRPGKDRPIAVIMAIQTFTVIAMVFFATFIALYHSHGYNANFVPNYIIAYVRNFVMALPLQLLIVGPIARGLFRAIFRREKKEKVEAAISAEPVED